MTALIGRREFITLIGDVEGSDFMRLFLRLISGGSTGGPNPAFGGHRIQ
jgi:hypothetical protein